MMENDRLYLKNTMIRISKGKAKEYNFWHSSMLLWSPLDTAETARTDKISNTASCTLGDTDKLGQYTVSYYTSELNQKQSGASTP